MGTIDDIYQFLFLNIHIPTYVTNWLSYTIQNNVIFWRIYIIIQRPKFPFSASGGPLSTYSRSHVLN